MKKEFFHSSLRLWEDAFPARKNRCRWKVECLDVQQHIRELMEERGWSEYKLAKMANLPQSTISNLFKRNNVPTLYTLEAICKAFGMTLAQFFSEGKEPMELTEEQRALFAKWATLSEEQKRVLFELINIM